MVAALYRRYRPETFSELIGQAHVTDPLRTALRADRVNHAYLFSGPRGCGKTTSARILARCLNCAQGPTPEPCGECDSCVELGRDGGGSLDVVEIDAASHGGVDDARDLRERATFAPTRDRYKVFIIDEAHMVTSGGFNALLKIVEEPPEHIKFIFATTEPEKVIGTIRSRTHHYPFRLIAPAPMLEYVQQLCAEEGVEAAPGVLPLVVRAGGGSARDTLSLLDQLIAGSEGGVTYEHAVALLGFTHGGLLDEIVSALTAADAAGLFASIDRVVQSGQDPRRFVEDLLERLRDLIVARAAKDPAAILHGVPADELATLVEQARGFGSAELSRAADIVAKSLTDMAGATSPRLHLELMAARLLVPESGDPEVGTIARVERLEQRLAGAAPASAAPPAVTAAAAAPAGPAEGDPIHRPGPGAPGPVGRKGSPPAPAAVPAAGDEAVVAEPAVAPAEPITFQQLRDSWDEVLQLLADRNRSAWMVASTVIPVELRDGDVLVVAFQSEADIQRFREPQGARASVADALRSVITELLGISVRYQPQRAPARQPAPRARPEPRAGGEDAHRAASRPDAAAAPGPAPSRVAPSASSVAGQAGASAPASSRALGSAAKRADAPAQRPERPAAQTSEPAAPPAGPVTGWAVAAIPSDADAPPEDMPEPPLPEAGEPDPFSFASAPDAPAPPEPAPEPALSASQAARYGEAVVREELGAELIEERPRVRGER